MIETQPLEIRDFSGGITDYYIGGRPEQAQYMDNLILLPDKNARTRWGSEVYHDEQIPLGSFRINKLMMYDETLITMAQKKGWIVSGGTWSELTGPNGDPIMVDGDANSILIDTEWQGHLFVSSDTYTSVQKIYREAGTLKVRNAGLPVMPAGVAVTPATGAGASYLYKFVLRYDYTVDTVDHLDRGPVFTYPTTVTGGVIAGGNPASIVLPTTLTANENWDYANIIIEIYRTTDGGSAFFLVDSVTLGTTPYSDVMDDPTLQLQEELYTEGGDLSNDTPPKAKHIHVVNDIGYYGDIKEGTEEKTYLLRQSIPGDVDSVPGSFNYSFEQSIKAVSSIYDRPMVFCEDYIYRIDNNIEADGTGDMLPRRIDDRAGCVSATSVVRTHLGVFWAGNIGFYWSDGFQVRKISNNINETYKNLILNSTRKKRIYGAYDPSNERVYWSVCQDDGVNHEVDSCFILDLKFHMTKDGPGHEMAFTTMSSGDYFKPTALLVHDNILYRGDSRGYVLQHTSNLYSDIKIDVSADPADWVKYTIRHKYWSCFLDFGSIFYRKWVTRVLISASNDTNLSLAVQSSNDNNRIIGDMQPIVYNANSTWGASLPIWGDPNALWNFQGVIEQWRRFPAKSLRCNYKQLRLTNAEVQLVNSDLIGTVTVDSTAKTAVLGGTYQWISDIIDYKIYFEADGYTQGFTVTASTSNTITFADSGNDSPPSGVYNFILKGEPKDEVLELNGYVIHWSFISKSHKPFSASSLGSTPGA